MPVYNAQRFLAQAIESILAQTYQDFELIIVDDASTDGSPQIIEEYEARYPEKVQVVRLSTTRNGSGDPATNIGIRHAKGRYIAKMDADDVSHPHRLEKQVVFLETHRDIFLVGTQAVVINESAEVLGQKNNPLRHEDIYRNFFLFNYINHSSIMFRNEQNREDFYKLAFPYFNEYWTFFLLMRDGKKFANLPDYLISYRLHGKNESFLDINKKFITTSAIRKAFIQKGFRPKPSHLILATLQSFAVFCMSQKLIFLLYLLSRKILPPHTLAKKIYSAIA